MKNTQDKLDEINSIITTRTKNKSSSSSSSSSSGEVELVDHYYYHYHHHHYEKHKGLSIKSDKAIAPMTMGGRIISSELVSKGDIDGLLDDIEQQFLTVQNSMKFIRNQIDIIERKKRDDDDDDSSHSVKDRQMNRIDFDGEGSTNVVERHVSMIASLEHTQKDSSNNILRDGNNSRLAHIHSSSPVTDHYASIHTVDSRDDSQRQQLSHIKSSYPQHLPIQHHHHLTPSSSSSSSSSSLTVNHQKVVMKRSWDTLRRSLKLSMSKRPVYNFELYEQLCDMKGTDALSTSVDIDYEGADDATKKLLWKQVSTIYRSIKSSQKTRDDNVDGTYKTSLSSSRSYQHQLPLSTASLAIQAYRGSIQRSMYNPFYNISSPFPVEKPLLSTLPDDSLGDWRHISGALTSPTMTTTTVTNSNQHTFSSSSVAIKEKQQGLYRMEDYESPIKEIAKAMRLMEKEQDEQRQKKAATAAAAAAGLSVKNKATSENKIKMNINNATTNSNISNNSSSNSINTLMEVNIKSKSLIDTSSNSNHGTTVPLTATKSIKSEEVNVVPSSLSSSSSKSSSSSLSLPTKPSLSKVPSIVSSDNMNDLFNAINKNDDNDISTATSTAIANKFTTTPTASTTTESTESRNLTVLERVHEIYNQHNPSRIIEIPTIMEKYKGKESELIIKLEQKYKIQSSNIKINNNNSIAEIKSSKVISEQLQKITSTSNLSNSLFGNKSSSTSLLTSKSMLPTTQASPSSSQSLSSSLSNNNMIQNTSKSVIESENLKLGSQKDPSLGLSAPALKAAPSVSERVHEIYNQYNPSKISEIPTILEKYKGKEQELISKLEQKYKIPPQSTTATDTTTEQTNSRSNNLWQSNNASKNSLFGSKITSSNNNFNSANSTGLTKIQSMDGNQNTAASGQFSIFNKSAGSTTFNATNPTSTPFSGNKVTSTLFGGANTSNSTPSVFGATSSSTSTTFGSNNPTVSPFGNANSTTTPSLFGGTQATLTPFNTGGNQSSTVSSSSVKVSSTPFNTENKASSSSLFGGMNATTSTPTPFSSNISNPPSTLFGSLSQSSSGQPSLFGMNTATHNTTSSALTPFSGSNTSSSSFGGSGGNSLFKTNSNTSTATGWNNASNAGGSMNAGGFATPATSMNTNPSIFGNSNMSMMSSSVSQRVHEIYNQYNPSKISEIPTILEKYKGKEQELISKLEQKYGIASSAIGSNNSSAFGGSFGVGIGYTNNNNKPAGVSSFGSFSSFGQPQQQQQQQSQQQASTSLFGSSGQVGMGGARFGATSALGNNQQNRSSLFGSR
jgi:hypothetical protein